MSATQFGLTILYVAVAVFFYAAGWWQARQSNAIGGKSAALHKINWCSINRCSGVNRVKSRWCQYLANLFERGS